MSHLALIRKYWDAMLAVDNDALRDIVTDDFVISGSLTRYEGKDAFIEGSKPVQKFVKGREVLSEFEKGDEIVSIYWMEIGAPANPGKVLVSQWSAIRDGKLASTRMIFDSTQMLALLPESLRPPKR